MPPLDPHSYADDTQPRVTSLDWEARVDFGSRTLEATATLHLGDAAPGGPLDLDSRGLDIHAVSDDQGRSVPFVLHAEEPTLGRRLSLTLDEGVRSLRIRYRTSPGATALQWLDPAQTASGKHPYLFSQCQAIHARSVVPLQDTPSRRVTYTARLTVPAALAPAAPSPGMRAPVTSRHPT